MAADLTKVVAFIPARGGSKGIPGKNLALVGGRPMLDHVVLAALAAARVDEVVVSTDDPGIAGHVEAAHPAVTIHHRSAASATDTASTESVMLEYVGTDPGATVLVLLQATSPLTTPGDVDAAIGLLDGGFDSVVSVVAQRRFRWERSPDGSASPVAFDPVHRPRRQDHEGFLVENGAVYATTVPGLLASGCRVNGRVGLVEMPEETYVEVDEPADLALVDVLVRAASQPSPTAAATLAAASAIRLVITDIDGCLTDNGMYYGASGEESKRFSARDGKGFELLRGAGIETMLLTSEKGPIIGHRAEKLQVRHVTEGSADKRADADVVRRQLGLEWSEVAFLGDDVHDVELLRTVGLAACPADAHAAAVAAAAYRCRVAGGAGAFREVADLVVAGTGRR